VGTRTVPVAKSATRYPEATCVALRRKVFGLSPGQGPDSMRVPGSTRCETVSRGDVGILSTCPSVQGIDGAVGPPVPGLRSSAASRQVEKLPTSPEHRPRTRLLSPAASLQVNMVPPSPRDPGSDGQGNFATETTYVPQVSSSRLPRGLRSSPTGGRRGRARFGRGRRGGRRSSHEESTLIRSPTRNEEGMDDEIRSGPRDPVRKAG
jgi:hypothetical protein